MMTNNQIAHVTAFLQMIMDDDRDLLDKPSIFRFCKKLMDAAEAQDAASVGHLLIALLKQFQNESPEFRELANIVRRDFVS